MICVTWHVEGSPRAQVLRWIGRATTPKQAIDRSRAAIETVWDAVRAAAGKPYDQMPDDLANAEPRYRKATVQEQYDHGESDVAWRIGRTLQDHGAAMLRNLPPRTPQIDVQAVADKLVLSDSRVDVTGRAAGQAEPAAVVMTHAYDQDLVTFDVGSGGTRTGPSPNGTAPHRAVPSKERIAPQAATTEALIGLAATIWAMRGCPTARGGAIIASAVPPQSATLRAARSANGAMRRREEALACADEIEVIGLTSAAGRLRTQAEEQERC